MTRIVDMMNYSNVVKVVVELVLGSVGGLGDFQMDISNIIISFFTFRTFFFFFHLHI